MERSHNHKNSVELDETLIRELTVPDIHLHHFFAVLAINYHLRACILFIYNGNYRVKPFLKTKRSIEETFITPSLSPRVWMIVFFIINTCKGEKMSSICVLVRSQCMSNSSLVPSDISRTSVAHMPFAEC